jgi:hypothetical protein
MQVSKVQSRWSTRVPQLASAVPVTLVQGCLCPRLGYCCTLAIGQQCTQAWRPTPALPKNDEARCAGVRYFCTTMSHSNVDVTTAGPASACWRGIPSPNQHPGRCMFHMQHRPMHYAGSVLLLGCCGLLVPVGRGIPSPTNALGDACVHMQHCPMHHAGHSSHAC